MRVISNNLKGERNKTSPAATLTRNNPKSFRECKNSDWEKIGVKNKYEENETVIDYCIDSYDEIKL